MRAAQQEVIAEVLRSAPAQVHARPQFQRQSVLRTAANLLVAKSSEGWSGANTRVNSELRGAIGDLAEAYALAMWQAHQSLLETAGLSYDPESIEVIWQNIITTINLYISNWLPWIREHFAGHASPMYATAIGAQKTDLWIRQATKSIESQYADAMAVARVKLAQSRGQVDSGTTEDAPVGETAPLSAPADMLAAVDNLEQFLTRHPFREQTTVDGKELTLVHNPAHHYAAFENQRRTIRTAMKHLEKDGLVFLDTYLWRRFTELMDSESPFDPDMNDAEISKQRDRALTIVRQVADQLKVDLKRYEAGVAKKSSGLLVRREANIRVKNERSVETKSGKNREQVGYGWPMKLVVSVGAAIGAWSAYPWLLIVSTVDELVLGDAVVIGRIAFSGFVFVASITVANMIRKP